jgi:polyribonucleotide nucleotidyltransferase
MREFGDSLNAMDASQKAHYQAMATNAQQLVDMTNRTEQDQKQMTSVVDEDLMKTYEDQYKEQLQKAAKAKSNDSNDKEFDDAKAEFAKQVYGEGVRVDGNKIIDEKGETVREFTDD